MTDLNDKMRISPDPVQAEDLRQRLHARMIGAPPDDHHGRSDPRLGSGHQSDQWVVPPNEIDISEVAIPGDRINRRRLVLAAAAAIVVVGAAIGIRRAADDGPSVIVANAPTTTIPENGRPTAVRHIWYDGEVALSSTAPWQAVTYGYALTLGKTDEDRVQIARDPYPVATGCVQGPFVDDAAALARAIRSDPDLVATDPVRVSIGGIEGMAIDVTVAPEATACQHAVVAGHPGSVLVLTGFDGGDFWTRTVGLDPGSRLRLYLVDMPEGSVTRFAAIAVVAPEARFDAVAEAAAPILESIEFHPGES